MAIHTTATVDDGAKVSPSASVWQHAHIRTDANIGDNTVIGRGVYVGPGVKLGANCKVQNYALVYEPAVLEEGVFVGPAAVFTNDKNPRAVNPDGTQKSAADWQPVGVVCEQGSSIGASATCVAPVRIGRWAMVASGALVVKDVPAHALVVGVPARQIGWVGKTGKRLNQESSGRFVCPDTNEIYEELPSGELKNV